ncbi:PRC-barrel domain-containing protein [Streptomyces fradiae]|uniref:PRC-barrel domain-containing protein n=1 Tax=Streptomyces fradiae TaxID=1906 RepID=UPI0036D0E6C3
MQSDIDPRGLIGRKAFDGDGHRIGTVDEVYLDDATGAAVWAAVRTGLFGRDAFVPLGPSRVAADGLHVPYPKALVKDAPGFGVGRHLSPQQELRLYRHYGLAPPSAPGAPSPPGGPVGSVPDGTG